MFHRHFALSSGFEAEFFALQIVRHQIEDHSAYGSRWKVAVSDHENSGFLLKTDSMISRMYEVCKSKRHMSLVMAARWGRERLSFDHQQPPVTPTFLPMPRHTVCRGILLSLPGLLWSFCLSEAITKHSATQTMTSEPGERNQRLVSPCRTCLRPHRYLLTARAVVCAS